MLVVEDNEDDVELIRITLTDSFFCEVLTAETESEVTAALMQKPDIVLCDYNLPRLTPLKVLNLLQEQKCEAPLVVVTRAIGEDAVVNILRSGARDYVAKDKLATLPTVIQRLLDERTAAARESEIHQKLLSAHKELAATHLRLRAMSARMVAIQEAERKKLARELHDSVGQALTGIHMYLEGAERVRDTETAQIYRDACKDQLREAIELVKNLSFDIRPAQLDIIGLGAAIRSTAQRHLEPFGCSFQVKVIGDEAWADKIHCSVLLRIIQEALVNIVRHASATNVAIKVRISELGRISTVVRDNGKGFDVRELSGPTTTRNLGLASMQERCELVGGKLKIVSSIGKGTIVFARL